MISSHMIETDQFENAKCRFCHQPIFVNLAAVGEERTVPGCIYSFSGIREYQISQSCEACFDRITAEPEEDEEQQHLEDISDDFDFDPYNPF